MHIDILVSDCVHKTLNESILCGNVVQHGASTRPQTCALAADQCICLLEHGVPF